MASDDPSNVFYEYFYALGQFIATFASVEHLLAHALKTLAGVTPEVALAIFSGDRIDTVKSKINRIRDFQGLPRDPDLERAFAQLTQITNVRNNLVHYRTYFLGFEAMPTVSNKSATRPEQARTTEVPPQVLYNMTRDLDAIQSTIILTLLPGDRQDRALDAIRASVRTPWHYKSA